jgi:ribosomal protein S18 acetylase RimI-like enzyme
VDGVTLRPATDADRTFLFDVYAATRAEELAVVPWTDEQKQQFLTQQFEAQDASYRQRFPEGRFLVIQRHGERIGRLCVGRLPAVGDRPGAPAGLRIMDIAVLPAHQGQGIGTALVEDVLEEADAEGLPVSLHVEQWNPAQRLYARLGFSVVGQNDVYFLLERPAPSR